VILAKPSLAEMPAMEFYRIHGAINLHWIPMRVHHSFRAKSKSGLLALCWLIGSVASAGGQTRHASWQGQLREAAGKPVGDAAVVLQDVRTSQQFRSFTDANGSFRFSALPPGGYSISISWRDGTAVADTAVAVHEGERRDIVLRLSADRQHVHIGPAAEVSSPQASGGERLTSAEVANLPLNKRDFSQLLLLAAGTMTDVNGASNFTQQYSVNGQRGITAVFAMDGLDITDPELGGATFSNFNVDAIQELRSSSGVMPAEIGHGAASFTDIITKSGTSAVHGSLFWFVRNAALDARNYFDRQTTAQPRRIPPFNRNEFGFTQGGPVVLPGIHEGRSRTFYFGQYQGFRQILGTTQVFPVPTPEERQGLNTTAFPGDTLLVPVSPEIAPILARYPLPNDPQGPYGSRTYAASSKISTNSDQFSIRIDHAISDKAKLFTRFSLNSVRGPVTNPSQSAIDPSFGIHFFDNQRNAGFAYTREVSPSLIFDFSFGYIRSTPFFEPLNQTQPAIKFADGLYEPFNLPGGTVTGSFGNLFQIRSNLAYVRGTHSFKMGFEGRHNHDTTVFGTSPNGEYTFGGGTTYSPEDIRSVSGSHDLRKGDPLPDTLTALLTATPFVYTAWVAPPMFAQGNRIGESAVRRESYNFYFQDQWKLNSRLTLSYGLRYEINPGLREAKNRTAMPMIVGPDDRPVPFWDEQARIRMLVNPKPVSTMDWRGWGPRASLAWQVTSSTVFRTGGSITTRLPNLWQDNCAVGGFPFVYSPYLTAALGSPVPFVNAPISFNLPPVYTPQGELVFATGRTTDVPPNTEIDVQRFQNEVVTLNPGSRIQPLMVIGISPDYRNGYIETYMAGLEHNWGDINFSASYVATAGVGLPSLIFPNHYAGAAPAYARFTQFDAAGQVVGGMGPLYTLTSASHSTYHSLQASAQKSSARAGIGFQVSYTFGKSLDDLSSLFEGYWGTTLMQARPQDPWNQGVEKGPSSFDIPQSLAVSLILNLPIERVRFLQPLGGRFTNGWRLLNVGTLSSGLPFSVFSGIQQTAIGSANADRPDQVGTPRLSTGGPTREDYFGGGTENTSFFSIPIDVPGGTGPNRGKFGTLGRNTFRGPLVRTWDMALIKDTSFGHRGNGELFTLQFRAEFFNVFNNVNFGVPANIVRGTGFGYISRTATSSRQIQFSLKLMY
jgi:hypothetical protein